MGDGSGWTQFSYLVSPLEALQARAREEGAVVHWVTDYCDVEAIDRLATVKYNDACLIFINSNASEAPAAI